MLVKEFEGKTKEDALANALKTLNLEQSQIKKYEIVEETQKRSFFWFGSQCVKIKIFYYQEASSFAYQAKKKFESLAQYLNISCQFVSVDENEERIIISFTTSDSSVLIGKYGKTLESIQIWLNMVMLNHIKKTEYKKIILDIERYWDRKGENLKKLAYEAVDYIRSQKKSKLLPEMSPFERRLVHISLKSFEDIITKSEGQWPNKRVRISLKDYSMNHFSKQQNKPMKSKYEKDKAL